MIEKTKSIFLTILVILSLVLTTTINLYDFNKKSASLSEYYPQILLGDLREIEQLIMPSDIYVHQTAGKHTALTRGNSHYNVIYSEIKKFNFFSPVLVTEDIDWSYLRNERAGIELVFATPLDADVLRLIFEQTTRSLNLQAIDSILFSVDEKFDVEAYFISAQNDRVYMARTINTVPMLDLYLESLEDEPNYVYHLAGDEFQGRWVERGYYLPEGDLDVDRKVIMNLNLTENNIVQMIFSVPSSVRTAYTLDKRDSILYTDGISSLDYNNVDQTFNYNQPIIDAQRGLSIDRELAAATKFINQHGGWDGDYVLTSASKMFDDARVALTFTMYVEGIQLYPQQVNYGQLRAEANVIIGNYQRSTLFVDRIISSRTVSTSASELWGKLALAEIERNQIRDIKLAYIPRLNNNNVILDPCWLIDLGESTNLLIGIGSEEVVSSGLGKN